MRWKMMNVSTLLMTAVLVFSGCQSEVEQSGDQHHVFGDGTRDQSRVLARVNGYEITEKMLNLRIEELDSAAKSRYDNQEGRRLFLRGMVDEALQVQDALARNLHREPLVARILISERRDILTLAQRADLTKEREPDIDEVRAYFDRHRDEYRQLGVMHASHVECLTREDAQEVYRLLTEDDIKFDRAVQLHSKNNETKLRGGSLGYFNPGSYIADVVDPNEFTAMAWELDERINPPVEHNGRWHVIMVHEKTPERRQSLEEAYSRVVVDMQDEFHYDLIENWLRRARDSADIEYFGYYRPGQGMTAQQLMERAFYINDPAQQLDLLRLVVDDYPQSEFADKALLMAASIAMDSFYDNRLAAGFLNEILTHYPDSEVADDASYMLENMNRRDFVTPQSIEDLRKGP